MIPKIEFQLKNNYSYYNKSSYSLCSRELSPNEPIPLKGCKVCLPRLDPKTVKEINAYAYNNTFLVTEDPIFTYDSEHNKLTIISILVDPAW